MDREKILKGLECCQHFSKSHCDGCPYDYNARGYCNECTADLASDVLSLLKEQASRVLTVDEVRNSCPDHVYLETKSGWFECSIQDHGESDKYVGVFVYGADEYFRKPWSDYGKLWRCWNKRPTDNQRRAAKWE